jgi:hypothetical protein
MALDRYFDNRTIPQVRPRLKRSYPFLGRRNIAAFDALDMPQTVAHVNGERECLFVHTLSCKARYKRQLRVKSLLILWASIRRQADTTCSRMTRASTGFPAESNAFAKASLERHVGL